MLPKLPNWKAVEARCTRLWQRAGVYAFRPRRGKPLFVIDTPPPFTSGALHMGHMLSYSYIDFAARYKRMKGYNVYYPQGWDCQGFPTEVKVEQAYGRLPRQEFLKRCRAFSEANIKAMRRQMIAMGLSPDWRYEYKTMEKDYHATVQRSLLQMYDAGLIYRARAPVLFCTHCRSAIAKAELEEATRTTQLHYIDFKVGGESVEVATTRPELLHACVALAINPGDERYQTLPGKKAVTPLGKEVPIISDVDVDPSFGTGVVMICTFGDKLDVVWAARHNLPIIEAMDEGGRLLNAGPYTGLEAPIARQRIVNDLREKGLLRRSESIAQSLRVHDRCGRAVEWLLSWQWFARVKEWRDAIIKAAREMRWIPEFTITHLIDWTNALEWDWCISRQRVFGTPLPFWLCQSCSKIYKPATKSLPVDPTRDAPPKQRCECGGALVGESSTCDCWIDSSITPIIIAQRAQRAGIKNLYPATLRPQGLEIIRSWAFYTIYRCLALTGQKPFKEVLINGTVLGADGRKMSKSLGNYEDPDVLLKKYPADALRQWAALSGALAHDRAFSYRDIERGQAFLTKLWNAARFAQSAGIQRAPRVAPGQLRAIDRALISRLQRLIKRVSGAFEDYNYYDAINAIHAFVWSDLCSNYLEQIKHRLHAPRARAAQGARLALHTVLSTLLRLLAPITPFVCEELNQRLFNSRQSIHAAQWPRHNQALIDERAEELWQLLNQIAGEIKRFRAQHSLPHSAPLQSIEIKVPEALLPWIHEIEDEIKALARTRALAIAAGALEVKCLV